MARCDRFPLPKGWPKTIRSSVLHAVSLASGALTTAWARAARNRSPRGGQVVTELERAKTEIALRKEELSIKDSRWGRVPPRRRPYYSPRQGARILRLKGSQGLVLIANGRNLPDSRGNDCIMADADRSGSRTSWTAAWRYDGRADAAGDSANR